MKRRVRLLHVLLTLILASAAPFNAFAARDFKPPASTVTNPKPGLTLSGPGFTISGTATDGKGTGVQKVEVSIDGGTSWHLAAGTTSWGYAWTLPMDGSYTIESRATDSAGNVETPGPGVTVEVDNEVPVTTIACPTNGAAVKGPAIKLSGTASDGTGSGVRKVEISTDGNTWDIATGTTGWSYDLTLPSPANYSMWRVASAMIRDGQSSNAITVRVKHLLKADGSKVRVGFVSGPTQAITINEAYIGNDAGGGAVSGNMPLTFSGNNSVTVPAGETIFSDPVSWNATRGGAVVVTIYGAGRSLGKSFDCAGYYEDGNVAGVSRALANMSPWYYGYDIWNALVVEVLEDGVTANEDVLLIGDSITFGSGSEVGGGKSWAELLGEKVNAVNAALAGTTAAHEAGVIAGILGRGIRYDKAIVSLGTNDIGLGHTEDEIKADLDTIFTALQSAGIAVYAGNITPRHDDIQWDYERVNINNWLKTLPCSIEGVIDFDAAVRDPASPNKMLPEYDAGDGVHPSGLGHAAMFGAIDKENLFTAGMVININARATDNAGNVENPYPSVKVTMDNSAPASTIVNPVNDETLHGATFTIRGTADDVEGSGIDKVEVSTDSGNTWHHAAGTTSWSYAWTLLPSGGTRTLKSRATDNAGNVETPGEGATVTITPYGYGPNVIGTRDLPHCNWNAVFIPNGTDCTFCHIVPDKFLAADFKQAPGFCNSCHNPAGSGHALAINGSPGQHVMFANATAAGRKRPSFGSITTGQWNDIPASRLKNGYQVACITCHNDMRKLDDPGRTWEYTTTTDRYKYYLQSGGWTGYGNLTPKVYRDTSLWSGPTYSKTRKNYLVDPSEYTYNEMSGLIRFNAQQGYAAYIYATLYYPYLRAPMQDNALCADCHIEATHMDINCLNCHQAHNTDNLKGIKQKVRASNYTTVPVRFLRYTGMNSFADGDATHDGICEVCHTKTKYYRKDGSGFTNHSGGGANYDRKDCTACHSHSTGFAR